ncbi:MAG: lamin tail domain-containing protein [Archangium sp.]|nr:lamin tail domain-containing protein [Archangium sp.]MDP3574331.1 lamin tail domain-containing protein [Archangium sp.]
MRAQGLFVFAVSLSLFSCDCGNVRVNGAFDSGCVAELCDGFDQDCDGVVDNGLPVLSCGLGACARTTSSCIAGMTTVCEPGTPVDETCNGLDDDCNGEIDDNLAPLGCGVGACATTASSCFDGQAQTCEPGQPAAELCDGVDNDCDGQTDEELPPVSCGTGACARTVASCADAIEQSCVPGAPSTEVCDGLDNNCNGEVDEAQAMLSCGVGACGRTVPACVAGQGQVCSPGAPSAEQCNGLDDDCDGQLDNGLGPVSCGLGTCARTVASCVNGAPQACVPGNPAPDVCDGLDNDCDGSIDDDGICSPPVVLCSGSVSGTVGTDISLSATALDLDGTIVSNQWIVVIKPAGSTALPMPVNQPNTVFRPDVAGSYTLAFCARDNAGTTTCCNLTISTTVCVSPPSPPVSTACGTSWDGRPIVQFPTVPSGLTYQLTLPGDSLVRARANAGENYLRPAVRVGAGGPVPGAATSLEVRACQANDLTCCSTLSAISVNVVEACTTSLAPSSANLVISEYVVNGEGSCPSATTCQVGEAVELTNLSNCPVSLDGFHFAYRNNSSSPNSFRWMNFGPNEVVPPRGVYVAIRGQPLAPVCSASLAQATQSAGLFGLRISPLDMQGAFLDTGWFNNTGGGSSVMQVAPGNVPDSGVPGFAMPVAEVAPYVGGTTVCVGTGFNAVNSCGNFMGTTTPTTPLNPNQLGRLWHPCDAVTSPVPTCTRN